MHELSLFTWFIHIATVIEWFVAIIIISKISDNLNKPYLKLLSYGMLPNLASAMTAITWHIFDNSIILKGLVVLQASLTIIGNSTMALSTYYIFRKETIKS